MQPEDNLSPILPDTAVPDDEWQGSWGSISPVPYSIETLCIQIETEPGKPRIYYFPYRTIGKWDWNMAVPETLDIQAGSVSVTISGTGLRRLADALNLGQLRLVRLSRPLGSAGEICIHVILFNDLKN